MLREQAGCFPLRERPADAEVHGKPQPYGSTRVFVSRTRYSSGYSTIGLTANGRTTCGPLGGSPRSGYRWVLLASALSPSPNVPVTN